jgi:hypothetical protein
MWTVCILIGSALANERHFTYTYDSMVLPEGVRELEVWTTVAPSADDLVMKQRLEIEIPVTERLMTAFYMNTKASRGEVAPATVSSEWKLNVLSPVVKPVGLALYGEGEVGPRKTKLEAKVIADRQTDRMIVAYNLIGEREWEWEPEALADGTTGFEVERKVEVKNAVGAAVKTGPAAFGLELVNATEIHDGEVETGVSVGPAVSLASTSGWCALTAQTSVFPDVGGLEARLLVGVSF